MQTSLSGWLKKATVSKDFSPPAQVDIASPHATAIPTPPAESDNKDSTTFKDSQNAPNPVPTSKIVGSLVSQKSRQSSLHPSLSIAPINATHLPHLKRINALLLPIPYPSSFYAEILSDPVTASISFLALWTHSPSEPPKVIGGIRCRLLTPQSPTPNTAPLTSSFTAISRARRKNDGETMLYISTLTLLSPYRSLGVARELLRRVEEVAQDKYGVETVGAHVSVANQEGRKWYARRGFDEVRVEEGYYRKLKPQGAVVVLKRLGGNGG